MFPVNLSAHWQHAELFELDANLLNWLLDENSLTARLKSHCQQFRVQLLGQKIEACHPDEANQSILAGEQVLVREVLLWCDNAPQVFARSLIPLRSLAGDTSQLANLGEKSLGQVLFNDPNLVRKDIEVAYFIQNSTVHQLAESYQLALQNKLWGRRSIFVLNDKPLMVAEVFLPGAIAYSQTGLY
ncbi:MAG: chorismate--pyruvate lyase family protein [Thalassotalea sp.]